MTLKLATAASGVLRDSHHFRNPVTGEVERALLVEPGLSNLCEFNIPGGTPADWELEQLDAITNLAGEYGLVVDAGDSFPVADPGNFDPDDFAFGDVWIPRFDSTDGAAHVFGQWYADANNYVEWGKNASNDIYLTVVANGTTKTASLTVAFSAGTTIYIGGTLASGTLTLKAGTFSGGSLSTATATSVPASTGASWTYYKGSDQAATDQAEGAGNLVWCLDGTSSAVTDRYNSGAGLALGGDQGWLAKTSGNGKSNAENLVLHVGGNAAGTSYQLDTAYNALSLLAGTATGMADVSSGNYLTTADPGAGADGLAAATWTVPFNPDEVANNVPIFGRANNTDNQFCIVRQATGLRVYVASSGSDWSNYADFTCSFAAGTLYLATVTYSAGTIALYLKTLNATTRKLGSQSAPAASVTGTIPVTLRASALGYQFGGSVTGLPSGAAADLKLDGVRVLNGTAMTSTQADAQTLNEPQPWLCTYAWPFDGDGTELMGTGLTASWTGTPAYADDGRHHYGRMERYNRRGAKYFNRTGDYVSLGNFKELDGAKAFTKYGAFCKGDAGSSQMLFSRDDAVSNRQVGLFTSASDKLVMLLGTNTSGGTAYATGSTTLSVGQWYSYVTVFDGGQGTNATRAMIYLSTYDAAAGTWSAFIQETLSFTGTIPGYLITPSASVIAYHGRNVGGSDFKGMLDDSRLWVNYAMAASDITSGALTVYQERDAMASATVRAPDHWWTFDSTVNDRTFAGSRMTTVVRPTEVRADTGTQIYADGVVRAVASGELRNKHKITANDGNDYITTLLERAYENLVTSDDLTTWGGAASVSPGQDDPAGAAAAYTLTAAATANGRYRAIAFASDGTASLKIAFRKNSANPSAAAAVQVYDNVDSVTRGRINIDCSGATPSVAASTGALLGVTGPLSNGYYVAVLQLPGIVAAHTNVLTLFPDTASGSGSIDVYRVNVFDDPVPPESVLSASETTVADDFTVSLLDPTVPSAINVLWGFTLLDLANTGTARYVASIGDYVATSGAGGIALYLDASTNRLYVAFSNASTAVTGYWDASTWSLADDLIVRIYWAGGVPTCRLTRNGVAEAAPASAPGSIAMPATWSSAYMSLGSAGAGSAANVGFQYGKAQSGSEKTLAQMQALKTADICHYVTGMSTTDADGTATGTIDWYDGRQPAGLTNTSLAEIDRATSSNDSTDGTYGVRLKGDAAGDNLGLTTASLTSGRWTVLVGSARETAGTATLSLAGSAFETQQDGSVATQASMGAAGVAARVDSSATASVEAIVGSGAEAYFDNLRALHLATVSPSSPTKGGALPAIDGRGGAWGIADASSVSAASEGVPLPYDSSLGSTVVKLTSGPAGTGTRRYLFGLPGEMNGLTAGQVGALLVGVYIPAASEIGYADVGLYAVDDVGSTTGMVATGDDEWLWLLVVRQWDASATEAYFELRLSDGVTLAGANEIMYMSLPTITAASVPGSPIANDSEGSTTATGQDTVYDTSADDSQVAETLYLRGYEVGTAKVGGTIYHRGSGTAGADPRVIVEATGGVYSATLDDGSEEVTSAMATAPSPGQMFELRLEILSTGAIQLHQSVNAATETDATASSAPAGGLPSTLAGARRYYGSEAGSDPATLVLTHEGRFKGSVSIADCRAFAGV